MALKRPLSAAAVFALLAVVAWIACGVRIVDPATHFAVVERLIAPGPPRVVTGRRFVLAPPGAFRVTRFPVEPATLPPPDARTAMLPSADGGRYGLTGSATPTEVLDGNDVVGNEPPASAPAQPAVADGDGDGLTDDEEARYGTSSRKPDTDNDGLFDREEVMVYKTNPLSPDTDGDTFPDGAEVQKGYNPNGTGKLVNTPSAQ